MTKEHQTQTAYLRLKATLYALRLMGISDDVIREAIRQLRDEV